MIWALVIILLLLALFGAIKISLGFLLLLLLVVLLVVVALR